MRGWLFKNMKNVNKKEDLSYGDIAMVDELADILENKQEDFDRVGFYNSCGLIDPKEDNDEDSIS